MSEKIKIEKGMLELAFENHSFEMENFLDIQTGKVVSKADDEFMDDEFTQDEIDENPERFLYIEPVQSSRSYEIMEEFINELEDEKVKNDLFAAIKMRKPFRSFKDRLDIYPEIQGRWYKHYDEVLENIMKEWLSDKNVDAELI